MVLVHPSLGLKEPPFFVSFLHLFLHLFLHPFGCVSISLATQLSICLPFWSFICSLRCLLVHTDVHLDVHSMSIWMSIGLSMYLSFCSLLCPFIGLIRYMVICLSIHYFVSWFVWPSVPFSIYSPISFCFFICPSFVNSCFFPVLFIHLSIIFHTSFWLPFIFKPRKHHRVKSQW